MKKKTTLFLGFILTCTMLISGCSENTKENATAYEKVQNKLLAMENFQATGSVRYLSNKNSHTYETVQFGKVSGPYRIEITGPEKVAGNITIFDGKTICQYNARVSGKILIGTQDTAERYEIFLTSFVKNYVKSQEVSVGVSKIDESVCTVLEAKIAGSHPYLDTEKLWVDNKTLKPLKLVVYDKDGGERVVVTYESFEYNVVMDDNLFVIQ